MKVEPIAKKAQEAAEFFEEHGRVVVGVTISGRKFSLIFADQSSPEAEDVDLVTMN